MSKQRNTQSLRDIMFDQLDDLIAGRITSQQAKAAGSLAAQIINLSKLELDAARFVSGNNEQIKRLSM